MQNNPEKETGYSLSRQAPKVSDKPGSLSPTSQQNNTSTSANPTQAFTLPVFPGNAITGWPRQQSPSGKAMSLAQMLSQVHEADAHFQACYSSGQPEVRFSKDAISRTDIHNVVIVIDIDCPDAHKTGKEASAEWRSSEEQKLAALHKVHPGGFSYHTRGGHRLVYRIKPFPIATKELAKEWSVFYSRVLLYLFREFDIKGDYACKDFGHLYRLPHVQRDGVRQIYPTSGDAEDINILNYIPPADIQADIGTAKSLGDIGKPILRLISPPASTPSISPVGESSVPMEERVKRALQYTDKCPPAVSGDGGHDQLFSVAKNVCRGFDLSDDASLEVLSRYNERCQPPFSESELEHKIREAFLADSPAIGSKFESKSKSKADLLTFMKSQILFTKEGIIALDKMQELSRFNYLQYYGDTFVTVEQIKETPSGSKVVMKQMSLANYYITHPDRLKADYMGYYPDGDCPVNEYNLYKGFAVESVRGTCDRILAHCQEVICDNDPKKYEYFIKWLAFAIQNPGKCQEVAFVAVGEKGTGKSTIGNLLLKMFGEHGKAIKSAGRLTGQFSAWLPTTSFLFIDEAMRSFDTAAISRTKSLVSESFVDSEAKFKANKDVRNNLSMFITSNDAAVVAAHKRERRFVVVKVSDKYLGNATYFNNLRKEINTGGAEAFLYHLQNVKLGSWHPRAFIETEELTEQKREMLSASENYIYNILITGDLPSTRSDKVAVRFLVNAMTDNPMESRKVKGNLRADLLALGALPTTVRVRKNNAQKQIRGYTFPTLQQMRLNWNNLHFAEKWDESITEWCLDETQPDVF